MKSSKVKQTASFTEDTLRKLTSIIGWHVLKDHRQQTYASAISIAVGWSLKNVLQKRKGIVNPITDVPHTHFTQRRVLELSDPDWADIGTAQAMLKLQQPSSRLRNNADAIRYCIDEYYGYLVRVGDALHIDGSVK